MSVEEIEKRFIVDQTLAAALYVSALEEAIQNATDEIPNNADMSPEFLTTLSAAGMLLAACRKFGDVATFNAKSLGLGDSISARLMEAVKRAAR